MQAVIKTPQRSLPLKIGAVRDYMVMQLLGGFKCTKATSSGYEWTLKDGRVVELRVTIKDKVMEETK